MDKQFIPELIKAALPACVKLHEMVHQAQDKGRDQGEIPAVADLVEGKPVHPLAEKAQQEDHQTC